MREPIRPLDLKTTKGGFITREAAEIYARALGGEWQINRYQARRGCRYWRATKYYEGPQSGEQAEQPFFVLNSATRQIIIELCARCLKLGLTNFNFYLFRLQLEFSLIAFKDFWALAVVRYKQRDVYWIIEENFIFMHSETD